MTIEEEIERAFHEWWNATDDGGANISAYIMPLLNRVRAEALREAADEIEATFADPDRRRPKHPKAEVSTDYVNDPQWAELIVRERAARIEQNSEGNET